MDDERAPRDKPLCGAKPRANGQRTEPCRKPPTPGATRCHLHGGKSPGVRVKAERMRAEERARGEMARRGWEPVADPLTALSNLAGEVLAWKDLMGEHVAELERLRYSTEHGEAIRGEVLLFERAMDRCASVLGLIAKLNIDERLARVSERQAEMLEAGLLAAFEEAGIPLTDTSRREKVVTAFTRHLAVAATVA